VASTSTATPIVVCDGVSRRYDIDDTTVVALDDVSMRIDSGQLVAVVGPSGSGKSTLLGVIGCVDRPTTGTVTVRGVDVTALSRSDRRKIRRHVAATMLPAPADNLLLDRSGTQNITLAARQRRIAGADVHTLEQALGIDGFANRVAGTLSGGEQQRLALACVLIGGTPLVLADEPTGALDAASAADMIRALVRACRHHNTTIIVATHDPNVADAADHVIRLSHGRVDSP
jgi:ABC-type lipoprotein export system ATPase subunit